MIILGLDPGTQITGYGLIQSKKRLHHQAIDFGCIRPPRTSHLNEKYLIIFESLEHLLDKYKPDALSIETQYVQHNIQGAIKLGMARGVCIVAAAKRKIPIFEYTPTQAKKSVVGNGRASKTQVQYMIQKLLNLPSSLTEDAADALALALCHNHQSNCVV